MNMVALESALPPLRVVANCLQFKRNPPSSDRSAVAFDGGWQLLVDINREGKVSSTVASSDKHVTAEMWAMTTTLKENVDDADKMQQACSDLDAMIKMNGAFE